MCREAGFWGMGMGMGMGNGMKAWNTVIVFDLCI